MDSQDLMVRGQFFKNSIVDCGWGQNLEMLKRILKVVRWKVVDVIDLSFFDFMLLFFEKRFIQIFLVNDLMFVFLRLKMNGCIMFILNFSFKV